MEFLVITYVYTAKDQSSGESVKAEVQAESEAAAAKLLFKQNLIPITILPKEREFKLISALTKRVKTKERILLTRQLSTLLNAGLPLAQALRSVRDQLSPKSRGLLEIMNTVITDVEGGSTLANALSRYPKVFSQIYVSLVAAGEASGSLDKSLERIATQQEKDAAITSKIRGALIYPAIVLFVILGVLIFMLTTVLPQIKQLYTDLDKELPFLTKILVTSSDFIIHDWWIVLIGLGLMTYGLVRYLRSEPGKWVGDKIKLKIPIFGTLFEKLYMARFCRTASVLLSSGLPLLEVLRITKDAVNNRYVETAITKAIQRVKGGKALSVSLEDSPYFLPLVPQMIKIGEQSGTIDDMLAKTAGYLEDELDTAIKTLSTTIEPLLMVVLGVTVGLIVAAILIPVYGLIGAGSSPNFQ